MLLRESFEERRLREFINSNHDHYLYDLSNIKNALDLYYLEHGAYPKNSTFDGVRSCWGKSIPDWIPGLAPKYIKVLPDIANEDPGCGKQYLYKSNGRGYKLLVHFPADCAEMKKDFPSIIDPIRDCFAYGYWNEDGKNL